MQLHLFKDTPRESSVLLNSVQEFLVLLWHIKEYSYLKNAIHQRGRTESLLLSSFQQGLRKNLKF